jgi:hypothetical protein
MRMIAAAVAVAVSAAFATGCASQMALVKGSAKKSVVIKGNMDQAFAAVSNAGKDLKYSVSEKRAKNFIGASRGMGYAEFSNVYIRFSESGGAVKADFDANSSKGSQAALDEYLAAVSKHVAYE